MAFACAVVASMRFLIDRRQLVFLFCFALGVVGLVVCANASHVRHFFSLLLFAHTLQIGYKFYWTFSCRCRSGFYCRRKKFLSLIHWPSLLSSSSFFAQNSNCCLRLSQRVLAANRILKKLETTCSRLPRLFVFMLSDILRTHLINWMNANNIQR